MNKSESNFWGLIRSHLPYGCDFQRIETGSTGRGIPDVNLCYGGKEIWVELKIVNGRKIDLSPEQVSWAHRRWRAGGTSYIMARYMTDGPRVGKNDRIILWEGKFAPLVKADGIDYAPCAQWDRPFPWMNILERLFQ